MNRDPEQMKKEFDALWQAKDAELWQEQQRREGTSWIAVWNPKVTDLKERAAIQRVNDALCAWGCAWWREKGYEVEIGEKWELKVNFPNQQQHD